MSQRNRGLAAQILKFLLLVVIAGGVTLLVAGPAKARGFHHGGGVHWSVGIGLGYWGPWPYYGYGYWPPYYTDYYPVYEPVVTNVQAPAVAPAYYYCDAPAGYYPYVANCSRPWRAVPLAPQR